MSLSYKKLTGNTSVEASLNSKVIDSIISSKDKHIRSNNSIMKMLENSTLKDWMESNNFVPQTNKKGKKNKKNKNKIKSPKVNNKFYVNHDFKESRKNSKEQDTIDKNEKDKEKEIPNKPIETVEDKLIEENISDNKPIFQKINVTNSISDDENFISFDQKSNSSSQNKIVDNHIKQIPTNNVHDD